MSGVSSSERTVRETDASLLLRRKNRLNRLNTTMVRYGKLMDPRKTLTATNDFSEVLTSVYHEILALSVPLFLSIPSDTGLVILRHDFVLVATKKIPAGKVVTGVPYTSAINVIPTGRSLFGPRDRIRAPIQKFVPFTGMGSFAIESETRGPEVNCTLIAPGDEIFLVSSRCEA